jgi:hypothetical protein
VGEGAVARSNLQREVEAHQTPVSLASTHNRVEEMRRREIPLLKAPEGIRQGVLEAQVLRAQMHRVHVQPSRLAH